MTGSMFDDVVDWFLSRVGDRRQYKRRAGAFHVWYEHAGASTQAVGTELSPSGLLFVINSDIPQQEFQLSLGLRSQKFPVRVKTVRTDVVDVKGQPWKRYACEFTGISADSWDLIVRYVNDVPEPEDRRKLQNQAMSEAVDDAYRLLPMAIQQKIVQMLVLKRRLEQPKPGQIPLLKLFYGGKHQLPEGKAAVHRFNVHSRIMINDEAVAYDTRFLVSESGSVSIL
ncbi:MAG TPA: PilZ domain-containing protein [Candidatus Baltobacteraceae bacterium]|nr:PilZ domain-containing protein [Candidatus Baltobacteraceae bacterium]